MQSVNNSHYYYSIYHSLMDNVNYIAIQNSNACCKMQRVKFGQRAYLYLSYRIHTLILSLQTTRAIRQRLIVCLHKVGSDKNTTKWIHKTEISPSKRKVSNNQMH